jgi:CPA2 family monovalent cation:H+ antiporter-2
VNRKLEKKTHGIIVGVERNGSLYFDRIAFNSRGSDILWIAGEKEKIAEFLKSIIY